MSNPPNDLLPDDDFYAAFNPKFEALQELSNIGVGHAATALSQLLNRKVDMSIPRVNFVPIEQAPTILATHEEEITVGVFVRTLEESGSQLNLLMIIDEESTHTLLGILRRNEDTTNLLDLDEISRSILKETGNILLLHTITAINSFTESHWFPNSPDIVIDMIGSMADEVLLNGHEDDEGEIKVLLVECDVFTDDGKKVKGNILLLPNKVAMDTLMNRLYGENWQEMM